MEGVGYGGLDVIAELVVGRFRAGKIQSQLGEGDDLLDGVYRLQYGDDEEVGHGQAIVLLLHGSRNEFVFDVVVDHGLGHDRLAILFQIGAQPFVQQKQHLIQIQGNDGQVVPVGQLEICQRFSVHTFPSLPSSNFI